MHALAEKLHLNKKQVSNFFERERRKANIVIESRRKGGPTEGGGGSSGNSSSSGSINGTATKKTKHKKKESVTLADNGNSSVRVQLGDDTVAKALIPSSGGDKNRQPTDYEGTTSTSELPNKRSRRSIKQGSYLGAFGDNYDEDDEEQTDGLKGEDDEDAEGEDYADDNSDVEKEEEEDEEEEENEAPPPRKKARTGNTTLDVEEFALAVKAQQVPQNPLVQKNKLESSLARSSKGRNGTATRYTARNARYASRSPLYAFPAAQALDNFRTAPMPPRQHGPTGMRRTVSASPAMISRSFSPLAPGIGHDKVPSNTLLTSFGTTTKSAHLAAPPSLHTLQSGARASSLVDEATSTFGGSSSAKRKRGAAASESPTVMFLRNPFPTPLPGSQRPHPDLVRPEFQSSALLQLSARLTGEEDFGDYIDDNITEFSLDPYQSTTRKRARVWFSRPSGEADSANLSNDSVAHAASRDCNKGRPGKPDIETNQTTIDDSRPVRSATTKRSESRMMKSTDQSLSDSEMDSSDDAESAEEDNLDPRIKKKKDSRPGAALRTNIACTELRQAFLANPHPPAHVLEALATRLGLGKKQVSNYFVRERKKTGYTIKVRHGLHRRRGPNKKRVDKPEVVVTQHDDDLPTELFNRSGPSTSQHDLDMSCMAGQNDDEGRQNDHDSDIGTQMDADMVTDDHMGNIDPALLSNNKDDVPDLSYDDQDLSHHHADSTFQSNSTINSEHHMSSEMIASKSMDSTTSSSRLDEDEELASPPFETLQLPSRLEDGKAGRDLPESVLSFAEAHTLAANSSLHYM